MTAQDKTGMGITGMSIGRSLESQLSTLQKSPLLPDFVTDPRTYKLTLMGLLYIRLAFNSVLPNVPGCTFGWKNLGFMNAVVLGERVHVPTIVGEQIVVLTDDAQLFPSDALITKIHTLAKG